VFPTSLEATIIVLLGIAPGYIAIATWGRAKTWKGFGSDLDTVLRALAASLLIQVPMLPLALGLGLFPDTSHWHRHLGALLVWLLLTVLVIPVGAGALASWIYNVLLFPQARKPDRASYERFWVPKPPSSWDRFFLQNVPNGSWLVIERADGYVAGTWEEGSYALTSPAAHGLYLKREWQVDEGGSLLPDPVPFTGGVLIEDTSTIRRIRIVLPPRREAQG
jgi:hypothetical protein